MSTSTGVHPVGQASDSLPSSWAVASLSAISVKLTDGSHNPPRDAGSGIPMLSSQNVLESGAIDFDSPTRYVSIDDFERENTRTNATPGDVLLTIVASLGRSAVVPVDAPAFVLQRSVAVIRTGLVPSFLAIFLRSPAARAYYDQHGKGTAQKGIYLGKLGELTLPIPPLAEQARIVARVDELMQLCDALEAKGRLEAQQHARLLETLLGTLTDSTTPEELVANWQRVADHFDLLLDRPEAVDVLEQTVLQLAVRGLLVPQVPNDEPASVLLQRIRAEKDRLISEGKIKRDKPLSLVTDAEKPFELPQGWEWVPLQHVGYTQTGTTPDKKNPHFYGSDIPFIKPGDIYLDRIDYENEGLTELGLADSGRVAPAGSVLMVCIGTIGKSNLCQQKCSFNQQINSITPVFCNPDYINLYLWSPSFQSEASARSSSTTISILNKGKWEAIPIALPPLQEQFRIVALFEELRQFCADLRQRLAASQATQSRLAEALVEAATA
jgi:type I restriction enzyme S subunit